MGCSQRPSVTLQGVSLGRFLAQFSQPNVVPSAGESVQIKNYSFLRSFIISTLSSHFHTSCPSAGAVPGQHSLLHRSSGLLAPLTNMFTAPLSNSLLARAGFWPSPTLWAGYSFCFVYPSLCQGNPKIRVRENMCLELLYRNWRCWWEAVTSEKHQSFHSGSKPWI